MRVRALSASVAIVIVLGQAGFNSQQASGQPTKPEGILEQVEEARLDVQLLEQKLQQSEAMVQDATQFLVGGPRYSPGLVISGPEASLGVESAPVAIQKPDYQKARANRLEASRALRKARQRLADLEEQLRREQPQPVNPETAVAKRHAEIANLRAVRGIDQVRQVDRAKRSGEIARLRAEVELLQLETEAAKSQLVELMGAARKAETRTVLDPIANPLEMPVKAQEAVELLSKAGSGDASAIARLGSWFDKLVEKAQAGDPNAIQIIRAFMGMHAQPVCEEHDGAAARPACDEH